ncbi:glycosyltransferase family 39 protein [Pelatocladus sp. BLCC-F211]|uniref:glycosyltransferase family 39 protein n=1 Tax=Pelatocladus sp. BLCC-F211 TaxID=3342752 RepID=UPI0035B91943
MRRLVLAPKWLQFFIVVLVVFGIFFRFVNLDGKVYSAGETNTLLRIYGYTNNEVKEQLFNDRLITKQALIKFQRFNPEKNFGDTIKSLAIDTPLNPPFYYLLARFWSQIFGDSITAIRILSVVISLLVFPCIYWLCSELFKVPLSLPGIAIALLAISPMQIIYAQEAQEYILWEVTILLSSAALLRALRLESIQQTDEKRLFNWGFYTFSLSLSLYTFSLSIFLVFAHIFYVIATAKFFVNKTVKNFLASNLIGILSFMPWILVIFYNRFGFNGYSNVINQDLSLINRIIYCLTQTNRVFFDLNFNDANPLYLIAFTPLIFTLVGYAIYWLWRTNHQKVWLFVISLMTLGTIPLLIFDLQLYLIPYYLSIQIAVAYLLATQLYNGSISRQKTWQAILVVLIMLALFSDTLYSHSNNSWIKFSSNDYINIANILNQNSRSIIIISNQKNSYEDIFSLSYLIEPKVRFLLLKESNIPKIPKNLNNLFLLNFSDTFRQSMEKKYRFKTNMIYQGQYSSLWKLSK